MYQLGFANLKLGTLLLTIKEIMKNVFKTYLGQSFYHQMTIIA
jgi:hypothetical protein